MRVEITDEVRVAFRQLGCTCEPAISVGFPLVAVAGRAYAPLDIVHDSSCVFRIMLAMGPERAGAAGSN